MPLHAYDPVGVARPFDSFNHSIRSVGHDAKISARLEHRLVMRAIHPRAISAGHLRETGTGVQIHVVMWFGTFVTGPFMLDFRVNFAGNILDQRTTEEDVQTLHAVADCEDWLVFGDGVIEKREIGALAGSVGFGGFQMTRGVEERRLDVRRAAGQDDCIQRECEILQFFRSEAQRDLYGLGTGRLHRCEIFFVGIALVAKFFFFSAIWDANTNLLGWCGAHEMPSYH